MSIIEFIKSTKDLGFKPQSVEAINRRRQLYDAGIAPRQAVATLKKEGY